MYTTNQGNSTHMIIENIVRYNLLEWANQFYQSKKIEGVSGFTLSFYKQQLGHFLKYCESQLITSLEEISPNVILSSCYGTRKMGITLAVCMPHLEHYVYFYCGMKAKQNRKAGRIPFAK